MKQPAKKPAVPAPAPAPSPDSKTLEGLSIRLHPQTIKRLEELAAAASPPTDRTQLIRQVLEGYVRRATRAA